MARWINIVETNCTDGSREEEFNDCYDNIHLPDVLETPDFVAATRYVIGEPRDGRGKYVAVYEIETDDIEKTLEVRRKVREAQFAQGRGSDLIASVSQAAYKMTVHRKSN